MKRRTIPLKNKAITPTQAKNKAMKEVNLPNGVNDKQKAFAREYIYDWNGTRAYKAVYGSNLSDNVAAVASFNLIRNIKVHQYIEEIQKDTAKLCGISKQMIADELRKIAFSSIAHLHKTWIELEDFENLTDEQKQSIAEINTRIVKRNIGTQGNPDIVDVEQIQIKLHDKNRAIDTLNKMFGFNEAEKIENTHKFDGDPFEQIRKNNGINQ